MTDPTAEAVARHMSRLEERYKTALLSGGHTGRSTVWRFLCGTGLVRRQGAGDQAVYTLTDMGHQVREAVIAERAGSGA